MYEPNGTMHLVEQHVQMKISSSATEVKPSRFRCGCVQADWNLELQLPLGNCCNN